MASDLMEIPCFADSVKRCGKYIKSIGYDIIDIITNPDPKVLERKPVISFLAITTMHVSYRKNIMLKFIFVTLIKTYYSKQIRLI